MPVRAISATRAAEALLPLPHGQSLPRVAFFLDRPYADVSGRDLPYRPATGARSGQPLAQLSDEAIHRRLGWL